MADAARKIDPGLKSLSDSLGSSLASESARVGDTLANKLGGSALAGNGFKKINDKIKDIGGQMAEVMADQIIGEDLLDDALTLALVNTASNAANDNIEQDLAKEVEDQGGANLDPNQAIDDFGNSALPDPEDLSDQTIPQLTATDNAQAANDTIESPTLKPNTLNNAAAANDNVETDRKPEPGAVDNPLPTAPPPENTPTPHQENTTPPKTADKDRESETSKTPNKNSQEQTPANAQQSGWKDDEEAAENKHPNPGSMSEDAAKDREDETSKIPKNNLATTPEKPNEEKESTPTEEPPSTPEEPKNNAVDKALQDAGLPLVDTDEDNPMLPKQTEAEKARKTAEQGGRGTPYQDGAPQPEDENPENPSTPPQPGQQRGRITQAVNNFRNESKIEKIEEDIDKNVKKIEELKNEIKKINEKIGPIERKIIALRLAYWGLVIVVIFLYVLAAVLAATIVFLFIIPFAPAVWGAAQIPSASAKAIDKIMDGLKKDIEKEKKEREDIEAKIKTYQSEIQNSAVERYNLKNQSLLTRRDPNAPQT